MPDEVVQAESSPASESTDGAIPESSTPEGGETPAKTDAEPLKAEESAPSEAQSASDKDESVNSSEESKRSESRSNAETRIKQLTARIKAMEKQMTMGNQKSSEYRPAIAKPTRPNLNDFETVQDYNAALDKYESDKEKYVAEQALQQHEAKRVQEEKAKAEKTVMDSWNAKVEKYTKQNPDFNLNEVVAVVDPNEATKAFVLKSDLGLNVLSYLNENPDIAEKIRDLDPVDTMEELVRIKIELSDQIKGIKKAEPPKPPKYVSGKGSSPPKPQSAWDILYS